VGVKRKKSISRRKVMAGAAVAVVAGTGVALAARQQTTPEYLYGQVIVPVVKGLGLDVDRLAPLLLGTALVESDLRYSRQEPAGPAVGLFQMEPATHDAVMDKLRALAPADYLRVVAYLPPGVAPSAEAMAINAPYAAAVAAVLYEAVNRFRVRLPAKCDAVGQANIWKTFYNTPAGKGTPERYLAAWATAGGSAIVGCR